MYIFPGLDPNTSIPPMRIYAIFLADRTSTLLLIALCRAHYYVQRGFELQEQVTLATDLGDAHRLKRLLVEAYQAWDQAAGYCREVQTLMRDHDN